MFYSCKCYLSYDNEAVFALKAAFLQDSCQLFYGHGQFTLCQCCLKMHVVLGAWCQSLSFETSHSLISMLLVAIWIFPVVQMVKNLPEIQETWLGPRVGKILWRREWPSTPVFLSGESHGQRSLVGHSPCGYNELDMTERLTTITSSYITST